MSNIGRPLLVVYLLIAAIFIADLLVPDYGANLAYLYMLPLITSVSFKVKNDVLLVGVVVTSLTITAIFLQPQTDGFSRLLLDRTTAILAIWAAVFLVMQIVEMRNLEDQEDEQFHALFQFSTNGILIVDKKGNIVRANPSADAMFGYKEGELVGNKIDTLVPEKYRKNHVRYRENYTREPKPREMGTGLNLKAVRKDHTEFPVEISLSPFQSEKGAFTVAHIIDATLRSENESRIVRQNFRLEQLAGELQNLNENLEKRIGERTRDLEDARNELAESLDKERELGELKSRFVSMASHEFRTPLSTIQSSAALINTYADRDDIPKVKKHALKIKTSVHNLNTILSEFLSLGKLEDGKTEAIISKMNIRECVEETEYELRGLFKPGQEFEYYHNGPEEIYLDSGLLKHTLFNLISNAVKYSPEDKPVRVETSVAHNEFTLCVIDRGIGIPEAEQKHLFSRFFRATNATNIQGTGLGLYIVNRYVELMGGELGIESIENQGTTVSAIFRLQNPDT